MNAPEHFQRTDDYASFCPVAEVSFEEAVEMVALAVRYACAGGIEKLLVDSRALTGFGPPTMISRFLLSERLASEASGRFKIVMVCHPEFIDPDRFGITVARNRGLHANVFASDSEALAWLRAEKAP